MAVQTPQSVLEWRNALWWAIVQIVGAAQGGLGSRTRFWRRGRARSGLLLWAAMLGGRWLPLGIPLAPTDLAPALAADVGGRLPQTSRGLPIPDGRGFLSCGGVFAPGFGRGSLCVVFVWEITQP